MRRMNMWQHAGILHVIMDKETMGIVTLLIVICIIILIVMELAVGMLITKSFVIYLMGCLRCAKRMALEKTMMY